MVGCTAQGVSISRSCAMSYCEPCQSLTAAALSRRWRVPQGNFEGATYVVSASVMIIEDGAQFFCMKSQIDVCARKKSAFADFFDVFWVALLFFKFVMFFKLCFSSRFAFQTRFSNRFVFLQVFFRTVFDFIIGFRLALMFSINRLYSCTFKWQIVTWCRVLQRWNSR